MQFTAEPAIVKEFERRLRVQDSVIKFLTVRIDETLKRLDKRKKEREKRAHRRPQAAAPQPSLAQQMLGGTAEGGAHPLPGAPIPRSSGTQRLARLPAVAAAPVDNRRKENSYMAEQRGGRPIAASQRPTGGDKAAAVGKKQYFRRKKVCRFCVEKIDDINYKDVRMLQAFIAERGKIVPRRISGVCAPHQRRLTDAILKARNIALLPFAAAV